MQPYNLALIAMMDEMQLSVTIRKAPVCSDFMQVTYRGLESNSDRIVKRCQGICHLRG